MRECDLTPVALAEVGHKEQVVGSPRLALGGVGGSAFLVRHPAEDATERHHGQALGFELDEEDPPGLLRYEWTQTLDLFDFGGVLCVDSEFFWRIIERQIFEIVGTDRPIKLVAEVGDELVEAADAGEAGAVVGR